MDERSSLEWAGYPDGEVPPKELMRRLTWDMARKIELKLAATRRHQAQPQEG